MNSPHKPKSHRIISIGTLLLLVGLLVGGAWQWSEFREDNDVLVILTGSSLSRKCDTNTSGVCHYPNKDDVLARFRFPRKYLAVNEDLAPYYNFIQLELNITQTSISEFESFDSGLLSAGGKIKLRALRPWDSLEHYRRTSVAFRREITDYQLVESEIEGTKKYDDLNCVALGLDQLDQVDIRKLELQPYWKKLCFSYRIQYYWWNFYPSAFTACPREQFVNGRNISISCKVASLVTPNILALYSAPGELVRSSSWIDVDRRIRKFIINHMTEGE